MTSHGAVHKRRGLVDNFDANVHADVVDDKKRQRKAWLGITGVIVLLVIISREPAAFYFSAFFVAPVFVFRLLQGRGSRFSVGVSILYAVAVVLALLSYRLLFFPYFPSSPISFMQSPEGSIASCSSDMSHIEAVYTWVNVTDPKWQSVSDSYGCDTKRYQSELGDADPFQALRFSIRSVVKNFPFVTKFVIVTERDQVPTWLDVNNAFVKVVFHDEYMPEGSAPVFNSNPIEYTLHKLKDKGFISGNCFLYLNDDFLIHKPLAMEDLVSTGGRIVFNSVTHVDFGMNMFMDLPFGTWALDSSYIVDPHVPYIINTDAFTQFLKDCDKECETYIMTRCNRTGPLPMQSYQTYLAAEHPYLLEFVPPALAFNMRLPLGARGMPVWLTRFLLLFLRPSFLYIDSHGGIENDADYLPFVNEYLSQSFPEKGWWEI